MQVLLIVFLVASQAIADSAQKHQGLYTTHVADYELVVPVKVTPDGEFLSHDVTHHHRARRSVEPVHYRLPVTGGDPMHLELWPNGERFLAPGLVIERWYSNNATRMPAGQPSCHFMGTVRGQPRSTVALSACSQGLVGVLRTQDRGELWLEPVREAVNSGPERPHIIFRRAANSSKKRKRKRKKKHEKNCGTKEPRRMVEARLEWRQQGAARVMQRGRRSVEVQQLMPRERRSVSKERHVEALLVADTSMMQFHRDGDVETYILTIMNMVSALYRDASIGNTINVVVVRIILLEDEVAQEGLNVTVNADVTLQNFCKWQMDLNPPDDTHPNHHDVAILITREDICARQNKPCGTLGVAHVAGMCQPDKSCNVNEDNGITLAHTITHEMGHNFGMYHDTEKIGCSRRDGRILHVMTPSFEADTVEVAWSTCSRRDITNFLDEGGGHCLEDEPSQNEYSYPELPAGAMYNAEHQCRLQFGLRNTAVCSPLEEICSRLWCVVDGTCTTMLRPAAAGTNCGKHMWCLNQECVTIGERPDAIHGGWGDWGPWSECSRTCGAGVSTTERHCDHPVPAFGGKFCVGERRRYRICNTEKCPSETPSFRAVQCSRYNDQAFHGRKYTWLPYFDTQEPCELYCVDTNDTIIVPWGETVLDGTPCKVGTRDMCIGGICKHVGCDWEVDSEAKEDQCGICHGDGSQCEMISGNYTKSEGTGYKEVVVIPAGSKNIKIEEVKASKNYIGIGSASSGKFFLNGKRQITLAGEYNIAGTPALYEREKEKERIHIPGPVMEDIAVYLIFRGHFHNFGLHYEYIIPKKNLNREPEYKWVLSDWSSCSATCGGGAQVSTPICQEKESGVVDENLCDRNLKPDKMERTCNIHPCPARWWIGPWQLCPVTCGEHAMRRRTVICVNGELALPDSGCSGQLRPEETEPCPDLKPCTTPHTTASPNVTYSSGLSYIEPNEIVDTSNLDEEDMEILKSTFSDLDILGSELSSRDTYLSQATTDKNHEVTVLQFRGANNATLQNDIGFREITEWTVSAWGPCSVTCGQGVRRRTVKCSNGNNSCNPYRRPYSWEYCHIRSCSYRHHRHKTG